MYAFFPAPQEEATTGASADAAPASGNDRNATQRCGTSLAKVAIVLPAQFFYLAEPTALAFPALIGLVTFLATEDPQAGRIQF